VVISYMANKEQEATHNPLSPHLHCFFSYDAGQYTIYELPPLTMDELLPEEDEPTDDELATWSLGIT